MLEQFYPTECAESAYVVNYDAYYKKGIRGILFDIDNTLVPHGEPASKDAEALFELIHTMGFKTCLISNNKEERVKPFAEAVRSEYIFNAHKPSVVNYKRAARQMGITEKETLFIGDQIFTDIYGANRAGIANILVKPIHAKEEIQIVLKRYLEKIILYFYTKNIVRNISGDMEKERQDLKR